MSFHRAKTTPPAPSTTQPAIRAAQKPRGALAIGLILASALSASSVAAQEPAEPPPNLAKLAAQRETETEAARNEYTYRQTVVIEELDNRGSLRGEYREIRDILF